jgi:predicted CXXCH cytochrome family protein
VLANLTPAGHFFLRTGEGFAAGVTCSDCHEPHGAKLRLPGDNVCLQCHASEKYAAATHHYHEGVSPRPGCPSCHMPTRTYMVVDPRHDHSFRIPRPDMSVQVGTPNACKARKGFQHYAAAFHAAWVDQADAETLLTEVALDRSTPAFARASALTALASHLSAPNLDLVRKALADPDPMVRIGALDMSENSSPSKLWPLASPLLSDSSRGVRIRAAALLPLRR